MDFKTTKEKPFLDNDLLITKEDFHSIMKRKNKGHRNVTKDVYTLLSLKKNKRKQTPFEKELLHRYYNHPIPVNRNEDPGTLPLLTHTKVTDICRNHHRQIRRHTVTLQ